MTKSIEENDKQNFLKKGFKGDVSKYHKKYLGTDVPDGYFEKSKISIIQRLSSQKNPTAHHEAKKPLIFWRRPSFKFSVAASFVFMMSLTFWLQNRNNKKGVHESYYESLTFSDTYLVESLWVDDGKFDAFADETIYSEIILKSNFFEQKIDNFLFENLIKEDSLLDNYLNQELLETIIL